MIEAVDLLEPVSGEVADIGGGDLRLGPVNAEP
jgi:hypothetical protein